jgi:hypothetical protein
VNGATGPGTFSGSLQVSFGATATINTVDWRVAMPDRVFLIANTPIPTQTSTFLQTGIPTSGCLRGCSATISGFFAGAGAERIGAGYQITEGTSASGTNVVGAAAFSKP